MAVSAAQREKAPFPMLVTEEGIATDVREMQSEKAPLPMLVTEDGISTEVSAAHISKE